MATGYQKVSIYEDGETVSASLFNSDFNALTNAFNASTGHDHDGTTGGGAPIFKIGDADFNNKIEIDGTNNLIKLFIEVGGTTSTEILNVSENALVPVASSIDLGTVSNPFDTGNITTLTSTSLTSTNLTVDTDTLYVDSTNHRVGINTTTPDESLHIVGGDLKISNYPFSPEIIFEDTNPNFPGSTTISGSNNRIYFRKVTFPTPTQMFSMSTSGATVGKTAVGASGRLIVVTEQERSYLNTDMLRTGNITDSEGNVLSSENSLLINNAGDTGDTIIKSLVGFSSNIDINTSTGYTERAAMGAVYSNDNITDTALVFGTKTTGDTNVVERIRIDSTGKLGINTATPKSLLDIVSDGESIITLSSNNNTASQGDLIGGIHFYNKDFTGIGANNAVKITAVTSTADGEDGELIFSTKPGASEGDDALESARIDSSGNLLVGHTDRDTTVSNGSSGVTIGGDGFIGASRTSEPLVLNREDSDGNIAIFHKDGVAIGSIGTEVSDTEVPSNLVVTAGTSNNSRLWLKGGDCGLVLDGNTDTILTTDEDSYTDGLINIGSSSNRFKDIHLSGAGVFGTKVSVGTDNDNHTFTVGDFSPVSYSDNIPVAIKCHTNDKGITLQQPNSGKSWSFGVGSSGEFKFYSRNDAQPAVTFLDSTSTTGGNVGIGTSSPETLLHLESSDATPTLTVESTDSLNGVPKLILKGSLKSEIVRVNEYDTIQTRLVIQDSGRFKVVNRFDDENFVVNDDGEITAKSLNLNDSRMSFDTAGSVGHSRIFFNAKATRTSGFFFSEEDVAYSDAASIVYTADDEHIRFANKGDAQVMSIKESKVGILTEDPAYDLDVNGVMRTKKLTGKGFTTFVIENKDSNDNVVSGLELDNNGNFNLRKDNNANYIIKSTTNDGVKFGDNINVTPTNNEASLTLKPGAGSSSGTIYFNCNVAEGETVPYISYNGTTDRFSVNDGSGNILSIKDGKVGVVQQTPTEALDVTGNIKATGTLELGDITLPNTDGTSGQALVTDGSGTVSFGTVGTPTDVVVDGDFSSAGLMQTDGSGTYSVQAIDGTNGQVLSTDGSGGLSWVDAGASDAITDGDFTSGGVMTTTGTGVYDVIAASTTEGHVMQVNATNGVEFSHFDKLHADLDIGAFNLTTSDINGDGRTRLGAGSSSAPAYSFNNDTDTGLYLSNTDSISIAAGGTEAVRVRSAALECSSGSNTAPGIAFKDASNTGIFNPQSTILGIATNGSTRITVNSSGFVGIGTTYAPQRLTVNGTVQASGVSINTSGSIINDAGYYGSAGLRIKSYSTSSSYQPMMSFLDSSSNQRGSIKTNNTSTQYNTTSDQRLKENIQDATDAGSKIDAIQIRQFDWIGSDVHQDYGVVAQELIDVAPEAVSTSDNEEDMMGVDYSKLVPMLIKEIQSLRSRVAELENN